MAHVKAHTEQLITLTVTLTPAEAGALKRMVQNPDCHPNHEDPDTFNLRKALFDELKKAGVE